MTDTPLFASGDPAPGDSALGDPAGAGVPAQRPEPDHVDLSIPGLSDLTLLAVGGYATIFMATQGSVGRQVAVKVENRALAAPRDEARFIREARAAATMSSHPHVVDLFDAGVTEHNHPYLVMELCVGSYQDRMPMPVDEVRTVGVKIAEALADAHDRGVLHRDLKPANILINEFGAPALADFGLAILAEQRDRDQHLMLDVMTPAYAPPEAFSRQPPQPSGDVYGLCATLYAMLSGAPPRWRPDQPPGVAHLLELFEQPVPDVAGVPPALLEVLRSGLRNDPGSRPTARQLVAALAAVDLADPGRAAGGAPPVGVDLDRTRSAEPAGGGSPTLPLPRRGLLENLRDLFGRS